MKYKINGKIKQILLGSILGDGSVYTRTKGTAFYQEIHSIKQKEYLIWKNNNCFRIFGTRIRIYEQYEKKQKKYYGKIGVFSKTLPILFTYRQIFYKEGVKRVSQDILNNIDELGLAVWYCDDGNFHIIGKTVRIMTDSFSYKEQKLIREWFYRRFNLECKMVERKRGSYYIHFNRKASKKFLMLIKNYVPIPMKYKLGDLWEGNSEKIKAAFKSASIRQKKYYLRNRLIILRKQNQYRNKPEIKKMEKLKKQVYYRKNREKILLRCKIYVEKNREIINKKSRERYRKNRERVNKRHKEYYIRNRESILRKQNKYNNNPEIKERKRKYDKERYIKRKRLM